MTIIMHQSLTALGWWSCTANWYCCGLKKASIIGTQTWFTFFMIFRKEVKTSCIKLYSERSHRHSTKLVEVSLCFPPPTPTPTPARRWKDGTRLMNKILINKCAHVACPNNVSLICNWFTGPPPPKLPESFPFFEIKIQE